MVEAKTKEQLEAEWWERWHAEDFTWEGLRSKTLQGWVVSDSYLREAASGRIYGQPALETPGPVLGTQATLQDYWRAHPKTGWIRSDSEMVEEIERPTGQLAYHRVHLPLRYKKRDAVTRKSSWSADALDEYVNARLLAADESIWVGDAIPRAIEGADRRAQFQGGIWLAAIIHPDGKNVPLHTRFESASFTRHASFDEACFSGDTRFDRVNFSGHAYF